MDIISRQNNEGKKLLAPITLREKIVFVFIALLFAILVMINVYPGIVVKVQMVEKSHTDMIRSASSLASALSGMPTLNGSNIGSAVSVLRVNAENRRIIVTGENGIVLFDTQRSGSLQGSLVTYSEVMTALAGQDAFYCEYDGSCFHKWAAVPLMREGKISGAVYYYDRDTENARLLSTLSSNIRIISIIIAVISTAAIYFFTVDLNKRFLVLLQGVREAGEGNFAYRIRMQGGDELNKIADEFNLLNEKIQDDEKARRQFVSDASHELKTPLASIKLLSDSIVNSENISRGEINEFLGDISNEIDRLTRISESLISINQADSAVLELYPCDEGEIVRRVRERLTVNAEMAEVTLSAECEDNCIVDATTDGLYHILFNLTENAIKYNRKGGKVALRLFKTEGKVVFTVSDTGIGIPEHEQAHVFERFFRVDKMRSRATGGTGLGLSIVKEWTDKLGGEIRMKSVFGEGTTFTVTFAESGADK